MASPPRPLLRRLGRAALIALGVLLATLVVLGFIVSRKAGALVHARAVVEAERLGARLGRTITVGAAHVAMGAELAVQIDDVRVAAAPGQTGVAAAPLFEVASVRVRVATWSILRSRGKDVDVLAIEVRRPVIRLVRLPGGALSYADVATHLAEPAPAREERHVRLGRVTVTDAVVELHDLSREPAVRLAVEHIDASIPELRTGAPLDLVVDAAVLAPARNLHLELGLGPPIDPPPVLGRLRRAAVRLAPVAIDPLVPFLPARGDLGIAGGKLSADLKLAVDPEGPIAVTGSIEAAALRLVHGAGRHEEALGPPVDAAVRADVTVDPEAPALDVRALSLTAGGMTIEGHADLRGPLDAPEVRALALDARDVTFERLLALAPPSILPRGWALAGPIALRAEAHGAPRAAELDVAVDLRDASVTLPELHKPAGTPLSATLKGRTGAGVLVIEALGVAVGPLSLSLRGQVKSAEDVDLTADSGEVALDAILRLFPTVARAVPEGVTLAGAVQASGHVRRQGAETHAEARVALRRAGVKTSALELTGAADLSAKVHARPGTAAITADLDAGGARVWIPGRLDKAAGSPLSVHAVVERAGALTTVREARLALAGATVAGKGRYDAAKHALTVEAPSCNLHLGTLARTVPALTGIPAALAGARIHAGVSFEGDPKDLSAAHLHLADLDLHAPLGHLKGTVDLVGLTSPRRVSFDLEGDALDLDTLPHGERSGGGGVPALDTLEVHGKLRLGKLHVRTLDARDVHVEGALTHGILALPMLRFSAFGGTLSGDGSLVDVSHGAPAFALRARVQRLDLATLAAGGDSDKEISGRLDAEVSLDGAGTDWASISPTLSGTVKIGVDGAHVRTEHTLHGHIVNPLLGGLAEHSRKKHPTREVDMRIDRASAALHVGGGKVTTTSPLVLVTDEGTLTVSGTVGFDKRLSLTGAVAIPSAVIEKASKGKRVPLGDVTVKVQIEGPAGDPEVKIVDLGSSVAALAGSRVNALVKKVRGK